MLVFGQGGPISPERLFDAPRATKVDRIRFLFTMSVNTQALARLRNLYGRCCRRVGELPGSGVWWSQTGSNRRPHACKARALPTELWPLIGFCARLAPRLGASAPAAGRPCKPCGLEDPPRRRRRRKRDCAPELMRGKTAPAGATRMVGLGGLEPPTSRLSSARSNQLSYKP